MYSENQFKLVGEVQHRSYQLIEILDNFYNWTDTYDAYLEGTGAIFFPFKHGKHDQFYEHENVKKIEQVIIDLCIPILKEILIYFPNARFIKGEMYCCRPGMTQSTHIDPKLMHRFCHRLHIPLLTNDQCFLQVEENHYHLETYKIYEFNNLLPHRSYNHGNSNRIHLIIDVMDSIIFNKFVIQNKYQMLFDPSDDDGKDIANLLKLVDKQGQ